MKSESKLSILIPSFRRKKQLTKTLLALQDQDNQDFQVIVCDNGSDYNLEDIKSALSQEFVSRVDFERNNFNVGATANITGLFLKCKTQYCWLLGDDDLPASDAVRIIHEEIISHPDTAVFHFPMIEIPTMHSEETVFYTLSEFVSFYNDIYRTGNGFHNIRGDLIFLSNKVYNLDVCSQCMDFLFTFAHTRVSQILPIVWLLDRKKASVRYIKKQIVKYQPPQGDHWNIQSVVQGMSNISFLITESLNNRERLELLRIIMLDSKFVRGAYLEVGKRDYNYLRKVYDLIFMDILKGKEKLVFKFYLVMSRREFTFNWLVWLTKGRRKH